MTGVNNRDRMVATLKSAAVRNEAQTDWLAADDQNARRRVVLIPGCSPAKQKSTGHPHPMRHWRNN